MKHSLFISTRSLCSQFKLIHLLLCFTVLAGMTIAISISSCSQESLVSSQSPQESVSVREPSEDLPTLCIGFGCGSAYQSCLNGGENHSCWLFGTGEINEDCCKEQRAQCHQCANGIICIRFSYLGVADPPSEFYGINYPFSQSDSLLLVPYWTQVDKFLDGVQLSDEDFEILDQDRIE